MNGGRVERLVERQRRQNRADSARHHRFACAGGTYHQRVVTTSRRDFERTASQGLSVHVGEVPICRRSGYRCRWNGRGRRLKCLGVVER
jgi:hypothetical protein